MWYGLFLGNGADAFARTIKLQKAFMLAFMAGW